MTSESEAQQGLIPENVTFILAIAGCIHAQTKYVAEKLDADRTIYHSYALLDSLNCSYSFYRYCIELFVTTNSDELHDLMMSPKHMIFIFFETACIVSFAVLASTIKAQKEQEQGEFDKIIASAWLYIRAFLKASKNAYKGFKSAIIAMGLLAQMDFKFLIIPIGLISGLIGAVNRFFLVYMIEQRKGMMENNAKTIVEIMEANERYEDVRGSKQEQTMNIRIMAYASVILNAFLDSLYLYFGLLTLTSLSPAFLMALGTFCIFYSVACIVNRVYEEYELQQRLLITHTQIDLALITRELQTAYIQLIKDRANQPLIVQVNQLLEEFQSVKNILQNQTNRTYFSALLYGLKNGLYVYSAISSFIFLTWAILALCSASISPALLIACVSIGVAIILASMTHSLVANYKHLNKEKEKEDRIQLNFFAMKNKLLLTEKTVDHQIDLMEVESFRTAVHRDLLIEPAPRSFAQEWSEVLRSFFSSLPKGLKLVEWTLNPLQEADGNGHYHDTLPMLILGTVSALLYALVWTLRAVAKGFGSPPKTVVLQEHDDPEREIRAIGTYS